MACQQQQGRQRSDSDSSSSSSSSSSGSSSDTSESESDCDVIRETAVPSVALPYAAPVPFQRQGVVVQQKKESESESDSGSESESESEDSSDSESDSETEDNSNPVSSTPIGYNNGVSSPESDSVVGDSNSESNSDSDDDAGSNHTISVPEPSPASSTEPVTVPEKEKEKKKKPFWSPKPVVFIKGLPFTTSLVEIKNFFGTCGNIVKVDRQLDDKKRWTGSIFMKFDSSDSVDKALAMSGTVWSGTGSDGKRFVTVDKQDQKKSAKQRQKSKLGATHSVFIGNLQKDIEKQAVQDLFVECGTINSIRFAKDGDGVCRGFGYIEFDTEEGKNKALTMNRRFTPEGAEDPIQVRKAQNNSTNQKPPKPKKESEEKTQKGQKRGPGGEGSNDKSVRKKKAKKIAVPT